MKVHVTSIDAREFRQTFDESIEPVSLFINYLKHFLAGVMVKSLLIPVTLTPVDVVEHCRRRCFDRSQRRAEVMRHGVKQRRFQPLALFQSFRLARTLE